MIEYPYIPVITGKEAERIINEADYVSAHMRGEQAPSKIELASARRMFQQAGLFL